VGPSLSLQKCITLPCNYFRISELGRDFCVLIDKSEHTGVYFLTACVNKTAILWDDAVKLVQYNYIDISKELALMMAAAVSSETSVPIYQTARCYI